NDDIGDSSGAAGIGVLSRKLCLRHRSRATGKQGLTLFVNIAIITHILLLFQIWPFLHDPSRATFWTLPHQPPENGDAPDGARALRKPGRPRVTTQAGASAVVLLQIPPLLRYRSRRSCTSVLAALRPIASSA